MFIYQNLPTIIWVLVCFSTLTLAQNQTTPIWTSSNEGSTSQQSSGQNNNTTQQTSQSEQQQWSDIQSIEGITPFNSLVLFINFQNGWINEDASNLQPGQLENFWENSQALANLAQVFGIPTLFAGQDPKTFGSYWSILSQNITNPTYIWVNDTNDLAVNDPGLKKIMSDAGRQYIIMAALTIDSELVQNAIAAKNNGYFVCAVVDGSPYFEPGDFLVALQNLQVNKIQAYTWFALSKILLRSQPQSFNALAPVYNHHLAQTNISIQGVTTLNVRVITPAQSSNVNIVIPTTGA